MSSLPARKIEANESAWLTAAEAAQVLGKSKRTVLLQCQSGRLAARKVSGEWYVSPDAAPALRIARGDPAGPVIAGDPLASLPQRARQTIFDRYGIIKAYLAALAHRDGRTPVRQFLTAWVDGFVHLHPGRKLSVQTMYTWLAAYRRQGIAGLIDARYRNGSRDVSIAPEDWSMIRGLYLSEAKLSVAYIYEIARAEAAKEGRSLPSLRTVHRWIREKLDPKIAALGREPKKFRDRCVPYIKRDWSAVGAMEVWVADHRQFDVWVPYRDPDSGTFSFQRPILTAYLDGRSWHVTGWAIEFGQPNGDRVMGAFARAVEAHGLPAALILDNGKDFRNKRFGGGRPKKTKGLKIVDQGAVKPLLETLGVDVHWAIPYNAKAKVIEPFFGVLARHFDKTFETYCGGKAEDRPERLKGLRADEYHARAGLCIDTFRAAFAAWLQNDYAIAESPACAAGGLSPADAFSRLRAGDYVERRVAAEDLALLLTPSQAVCVTQNGVWVKHFGRFYWSDDLEDRRAGSGRDLKRKIRYRYRPDDPSKVWVFDAQSGRFLTIATPYIGNAIHPLASSDADRDKIAACMGAQRDLAKRTRRAAADLRSYAGNRLLAAHADAVALSGKSGKRIAGDPSKLVPAPQPVQPFQQGATRMVFDPQIAAAALAALPAREQNRQQAESSALEYLATGTDDEAFEQTDLPQTPSALDLLADPQSQEPEDEQHDTT